MQGFAHTCPGFTFQQFEKQIKIAGAAHKIDLHSLSFCKVRMSYLCCRCCIIFILIGHDDICYLIICYQDFMQVLFMMPVLPASGDILCKHMHVN